MGAGFFTCRMRCADEASWSSQSLSRSASPQRQSPIMTSCCFCCDTRNGSLATAVASILTRGLTILGYYLMLTAPRYENTRLHKQDEKALINPHYVAIAMITESCIEIIFSVILLIGVIKANYRWLLPWIVWCFFNILYIFVIAVMQVLAAVFASSTHALGSAMGSWIGFFVSVYFLKCVLAYYHTLQSEEEQEPEPEPEPLIQEQPHCSKNIA
ncbi:uncharacterized protein LOC119391915 [Rhipicephalus sanguineus]|uniref:uncharacterized protein LOC119391915 n=1 Tax=Rhipicephalus sanguineus TaxID=34632 RepID=UPI0020C345A1|nr:uncharacterized protein LOC119391915 [Rhipicephalus sanguineus]